MPITPLSEQRDTAGWVSEMLPLFSASCATTPGEATSPAVGFMF